MQHCNDHLPLWLRAALGNYHFCYNFTFFVNIFLEANCGEDPSISRRFFIALRRAWISPCLDSYVFLLKNGVAGTRRASTIPLSVTKNDRPGSRHASTIAIFWHKKRNLPSATRTSQFAYSVPARCRHGSGPRSQLSKKTFDVQAPAGPFCRERPASRGFPARTG